MPSNLDRRSSARSESHLATSLGLFLLRAGAGFVLFYVEGWEHAQNVWQHLWHGAPWAFIDTVAQAQMPLPKAVAITIAIVMVLGSASWVLGFVTRFASGLLIPIMALSILIANRTGGASGAATAETAALYFFIALCLLISGPGFCSLDALFKLRRKKKSLYV